MIQSWWNNLLVWLGLSEPGGQLEVVEDRLTDETFMKEFYNAQEDVLATEGRYGQVIYGKGHPSDRVTDFRKLIKLPGNVDWWVDEWEGPDGKGWAIRAKVVQGPNRQWVLTITKDGAQGWEKVSDAL